MIPCCIRALKMARIEKKEEPVWKKWIETNTHTHTDTPGEKTESTTLKCWACRTSTFATLMNSSRLLCSMCSFYLSTCCNATVFCILWMFHTNAYSQLCLLFPIRFNSSSHFFLSFWALSVHFNFCILFFLVDTSNENEKKTLSKTVTSSTQTVQLYGLTGEYWLIKLITLTKSNVHTNTEKENPSARTYISRMETERNEM